MQYITYDEYKEIGGVLDSTAFLRNIDRVCGIIDNATHGRINNMLEKGSVSVEFVPKYGNNVIDIPIDDITSGVDTKIKALCRDMVEYLYNNNQTEKQIQSESVSAGSVSQSKSYVSKSKEDVENDIEDMLRDYLLGIKDANGTPLLYRGCSC